MSEIASRGQLRLAFLRWAVVTVPLILLLGVASARLAPMGDGSGWYMALRKPAMTPPGWLFPLAWTILYILMGLALAMVINARGAPLRAPAILAFVAQLIANLLWSPLFFGMHQLFWALVLIGVMFVLAFVTTLLFGRVRSAAAWLMVPYLAWIAFAGLLLFHIHQLNPHAEALLVPRSNATQITL